MIDEIETYTLRKLKAFLETLTQQQLDQPMLAIDQDGDPVHFDKPMIIEDDVYVNIYDDDDIGTLDQLKHIHGETFNIDEYKLTGNKGRIYFELDI